ncbi:MAG: beta-glucosidase [Phototrophicales bacterium]|nr:MAG: beta-glucosidase [Phototrophicales bacterium]
MSSISRVYRNETLSVDERVNSLLEQMTLDEKIAQLGGVWVTDLLDENFEFSEAKASTKLAHGIGHITRVGGASMLPPQKSAALANRIQRYLAEQTRLGIPAIVHEESCAGYLANGATSFPQAIGMAATWEPELITSVTNVIRQQMRSVGAHHTLAPVLDVARDPRWGRVEETFGEDPYLIASIGVAYIKGIQGKNLNSGIVATGKHFLGYGWSEGGMNWAPAHIPERELREIFLFPFMAAIKEGRVASIMNAYQELDGIPSGSSKELMVNLLREELGFDGVVVSDYFTLDMFVQYHRIARTKAEAAKYGLEAGIDVELPAHDVYGEPLYQAIEQGVIDVKLIDAAVQRLLKMKFELGLFETPYVDEQQTITIFNDQEAVRLSRQVAEKSIVLLKNDGILPLSPDLKTIAIIGPSANSIRFLQGDYHYPSHYADIVLAPNTATEAPVPSFTNRNLDLEQHFPPSTTVLEGIKQIVSAHTEVLYEQGCDITGEDTSRFEQAIKVAKAADVAIVVVGDKSGLSKDCTSGESIDRATLGLPGVQQQLVEAVYSSGTPTIVVLINGRPLTISWIHDHVSAIVEAWLPAQEGGHAVAGVLFGKVNPGGKLPISIPRHVGQVPVYYNHKPSGGRTHWQGDYIDLPTSPLYPFGHGLSYTTFAYSDLVISPPKVDAQGIVQISCKVTNTGNLAGDEVVQLYLNDTFASVTRPVKMLKGFKRIMLEPNESKTLNFKLSVAHLGFYDRKMCYVVEPGEIAVMIGSSSTDIRLQGSFEIVGTTTEVEPVFVTPVEVL